MAESITLSSETIAHGGDEDYNVNREKHAKMVAGLTESITGFPEEKRNDLGSQQRLMNAIVAKVTDGKVKAVQVKTGFKIGGRDQDHVSISVKKARSEWVKTLAQYRR